VKETTKFLSPPPKMLSKRINFLVHIITKSIIALHFKSQSKKTNKQFQAKTTLEEFGTFRRARDAQLAAPRLIIPSLQVNLRNCAMPPTEDNGTVYIKIPLNMFGGKK
jgi:hypothetical protein